MLSTALGFQNRPRTGQAVTCDFLKFEKLKVERTDAIKMLTQSGGFQFADHHEGSTST